MHDWPGDLLEEGMLGRERGGWQRFESWRERESPGKPGNEYMERVLCTSGWTRFGQQKIEVMAAGYLQTSNDCLGLNPGAHLPPLITQK